MKSNSKLRGVLITALVVLSLILIVFVISFSRRTRFSASKQRGNTPGNLYNHGLFCEYNGMIYFSNFQDEGALYCMTDSLKDIEKISSDNVRYINADEHYIYYSRMNNLKDNGIESVFTIYSSALMRITKTGKNITMLRSKPVGSVLLYDNSVFYQYYQKGENLALHKVGIDGENDISLVTDDALFVSVCDDKIYYRNQLTDHALHAVDTLSGADTVESDINMYQPIVFTDRIYYIDSLHGYRLCVLDRADNSVKILADCSCSSYNVTENGRYVYYQSDDIGYNGIFCLNTTDNSLIRILEGNYKWINIAGKYVFFYTFDGNSVYAYDSELVRLNLFNPPVLK